MLTLEIFYESFSEEILNSLKSSLEATYPLRVVFSENLIPPENARDAERNQYDAGILLRILERKRTKDFALWVVDSDIFITGMNFVFGVANYREAILSLYRLPSLDMISKEAIHEVGHLFGLDHCQNSCVMRFSNTFAEAMMKPKELCPECRKLLEELLKEI
ncbi:MAG: hypothetical protein PWR13_307 [Archaeoglobi archaeon]|nr:hypothetical protein [Archaeoglobi archaeon]MDK2781279.1 hypothetical protein [Archaeoglobi archaeon]